MSGTMERSKGGYREVDEPSLWFVVVVCVLLYRAPGLLEILGIEKEWILWQGEKSGSGRDEIERLAGKGRLYKACLGRTCASRIRFHMGTKGPTRAHLYGVEHLELTSQRIFNTP